MLLYSHPSHTVSYTSPPFHSPPIASLNPTSSYVPILLSVFPFSRRFHKLSYTSSFTSSPSIPIPHTYLPIISHSPISSLPLIPSYLFPHLPPHTFPLSFQGSTFSLNFHNFYTSHPFHSLAPIPSPSLPSHTLLLSFQSSHSPPFLNSTSHHSSLPLLPFLSFPTTRTAHTYLIPFQCSPFFTLHKLFYINPPFTSSPSVPSPTLTYSTPSSASSLLPVRPTIHLFL